MTRLDLPPLAPAEYLAADEVLLDSCESGLGDETLIFWEPRRTFVVVGYANKVDSEVNAAGCDAQDVPIFRRCSGGGTIVQMPGGLNYSLILRIEEDGPTRNIAATNQFVMAKNRAAIESLFLKSEIANRELEIAVCGHTDLALVTHRDSRVTIQKFSGNAQRRRKNFLLFHGTFLLDCDLAGIGDLLRMPSSQPDYRASRPHSEFVTNLNLPATAVKTCLAEAWKAAEQLPNPPLEEIKNLAFEKYSTHEWNFKF